ncbi:MAG TPA: hypothetical protein VG142_01885 [Trebonia sp.]|jgi:hypothetical protein|nr:hypothetical protein [Trebonia sp.]
MVKVRRRWRTWLAALITVAMTVLGLAAPAWAAPQPSPPTRAVSPSVTTTQPIQSLIGHAPAGGKRWIVNDSVAYGQAVKSKAWVRTPYGLSYTGCVIHVSGTATVRNGLITEPSGATRQLKPCEYPTLAYPASHQAGAIEPSASGQGTTNPATGRVAPAAGPCYFGTGGDWWAASCYGTGSNWVTSMSEEYAVPTDPAQDGALIFLWGGLEDGAGDTVLQDVLTWGANGSIVTNPNIWYVTPWYVWSNNSVVGSSIHVAPADTIVATLTASDCNSGGDCTWLLSATDETNGLSTSYTVGSGVSFDLLLGAVMEVPTADGCVETPANGHAAFRDLSVVGTSGDITPSFGTSIPDSQCSVSITAAPTGADILWKT